jgi:hypothetical protein
MPVLTHFCFLSKSGLVYAFDDRTATIVDLKTDLDCAVKGGPLINVLRTCGQDIVLRQEKHSLLLKDGMSKVELPILDPEHFVYVEPDSKSGLSLEVSSDFIESMMLVAEGCNRDSIRAEMSGITIKIADGVSVFSADSSSVTAMYPEGVKRLGRGAAEIIIPKSCILQVAKVYRDLGGSMKRCSMSINSDQSVVTFQFTSDPKVRVVGKLVSGNPLDYEKKIAEMVDKANFVPMPADLPKVLDRSIALIGGDIESTVRLQVDNGYISYSSKGGSGSVEARWPTDWKGSVDLIIDPRLASRMISKLNYIFFRRNTVAMANVNDDGDYTLFYFVGCKGGAA